MTHKETKQKHKIPVLIPVIAQLNAEYKLNKSTLKRKMPIKFDLGVWTGGQNKR